MKLYAQLNFGGNCEEAFRFYEKHLGGKIEMIRKLAALAIVTRLAAELWR